MDKWFHVITDLQRDMGLREIALKIGTSTTTLWRYKAGLSEPRYTEGQKLLALHASICSKYGTPPIAQLACGS